MKKANFLTAQLTGLFTVIALAALTAGQAQTTGAWTHPASPDPAPLYPRGTIPAAGQDFSVHIAASRTTGIAPLYVFFDATQNLKASDSNVDIEATYIWSFDASGVDANTRYDRVSGFVAGHVFNSPGTYTVRLDIFDKKHRHGSAAITITASEFNGTTYYAAANGNDSNSGTMQAPLKTVGHALLDKARPNTRVLFRNGDVFNIDQGINPSGNGPVIVSGYSDPARPSQAAPEIHATFVNGSWSVLGPSTSDWRFVGLKITSTGHSGQYNDATGNPPRYPGGIYLSGENNLYSRIEFRELGTGACYFNGTDNAVYECEMHRFSRAGFYSAGNDTNNTGNSIIGNYLHDMQCDYQEHAYRMQGGTRFFLGFNVFEADGTKDGIQIRGNSSLIVIYGNVLDRTNGFNPQNNSSPPVEEIHHCVAEANIFMGRTDSAYNNGFTVRDIALNFGGHDIMVRNNLVYNYGTAFCLQDCTPNIPADARINFENNTAVSPTAGAILVRREAGAAVTIQNNLLYSSATANNQYDMFLDLWDSVPFSGVSDYNQMFGASWSPSFHLFGYYPDVSLAQWQANRSQDLHSFYGDPCISAMDPAAAGFAAPGQASKGVNAGTLTGAWLDLYGRMRDTAPEIGAIESPSSSSIVSPRETPARCATRISCRTIRYPWLEVDYILDRPASTTISLYTVSGRRIGTLAGAVQSAGRHNLLFDRSSMAPGAYYVGLEIDTGNNRSIFTSTIVLDR